MTEKDLSDKFKKIKAVLTDVDGVLTDSTMNFFVTPEGKTVEIKKFSAYDGIAFHMLRDCGIITGIITGGNAPATERRAASLGMDFLYYNFLSKLPPLQDFIKRSGLKAEEIIFIGDDFIDIPALKEVGLPCAVANSRQEVKDCCLYITQTPGGRGAFREVAEQVLKAQGFWPQTMLNAQQGAIGKSKKKQTTVIDYKSWDPSYSGVF
ncbi:KdsC family phosphatase [Candidatus Proelusimicrobium volucris]|uniref:KdsC family phosphatase n=1 Tax=Candidatus Proelusimicrobium volucris TaxID=3416225 RepID=UPI003D1237BE